MDAVRLRRMTALQKPDGGVRGIVTGDVLRRVVSRTIAQQIMPAVERFTSPFQFALRTRAGTECVAHMLQALTVSDPHTTVLSIDGISAFDMISRRAMLEALQQLPGREQILPFVRLFYGRQSTYLWEDDLGVVHQIPQAEGGEQGDPLMPLLFALGIHAALQAAQLNLPHEMAFLDDVYIASSPLRVGHSFAVLQEQLLRHANIRVHLGKIKVWNSSGVRPRACDTLQDIATASGSLNQVWKGSDLPTDQQGIKVLGTPLGQRFRGSSLGARVGESPAVVGAHPSCSLLLHSAASRANYQLRVVRPELTEGFARGHDEGLWQCLCRILRVHHGEGHLTRDMATLPLALGGLGLRSALRSRQSAYWASWADTLPMVRAKHPTTAASFVEFLAAGVGPVSLMSAEVARRDLFGVMGFAPPSWVAHA